MVYAFGAIYTTAFSADSLNTLFDAAIKAKVNYENRLSLLTWLKDENDIPAYRYVSSVKDTDWKILVENYKRKTMQDGVNPERKHPTQDKPPVYDDTQQGGSSTPESGAAQMAPRDPTFKNLTKQYLQGSGKQG